MDLWEVSGGSCQLRRGRGSSRTAVPVRAEVTPEGVRLTAVDEAGSSEQLLQAGASCGRCCSGQARVSQGFLRLLSYDDLCGAAVLPEVSGQNFLTLRLVHCPKPDGKPAAGRRREDLELEVSLDQRLRSAWQDPDGQSLRERVQAWATEVSHRCMPERCHSKRPRAFLVFVNPSSGKGGAKQMWATARELWDAMGPELITCKEIMTTHQGHAKSYVQEATDLLDYDGIVIVSGDGLVHEVFNGLASRADASQVLQVPLGHIPGGSGNGLCSSILRSAGEHYGLLDASFVIAKGEVQPINLMQVQQPSKAPITSFMTLSGGIIGDIDIESDRIRCIGGSRFTVWAFYRVFRMRPLVGQLTYWPAECAENPPMVAPSIDEPLEGSPWKVIDSEFTVFWGSNMDMVSYAVRLCPGMSMETPIWNLVIVRKSVPRWALIRFLLDIESGKHYDRSSAHMEVIPCKAFRLIPTSTRGFLSLDGEEVPFGPTQVWPSGHQGRLLGGPSAGSLKGVADGVAGASDGCLLGGE